MSEKLSPRTVDSLGDIRSGPFFTGGEGKVTTMEINRCEVAGGLGQPGVDVGRFFIHLRLLKSGKVIGMYVCLSQKIESVSQKVADLKKRKERSEVMGSRRHVNYVRW
jgi:hypothetical protein